MATNHIFNDLAHQPHNSTTFHLPSAALLRSMLRPHSFESSPRSLDSQHLDPGDYRIGLIRADNLRKQSDSNTWLPEKLDSVYILPMTWAELVARIRGAANPADSAQDNLVRLGSVTINFERMEADRSGVPVKLTAMQFKVLHYFINNPRRVITRQELLDLVWGYNSYPSTRTVDTFISRLRKFFEVDAANPVHFLTVHGAGYKFIP